MKVKVMHGTPFLLLAALVATGVAFAANPILPLWEYIPDGEPYVFDDPDNPGKKRVYLYWDFSSPVKNRSICTLHSLRFRE